MTFNSVFYEFRLSKENIERILTDLDMIKNRDLSENLINSRSDTERLYAKVNFLNQPGIILVFSNRLNAERLPHEIEGLHAYIHPSSDGLLELKNFEGLLENSLLLNKINFRKYD